MVGRCAESIAAVGTGDGMGKKKKRRGWWLCFDSGPSRTYFWAGICDPLADEKNERKRGATGDRRPQGTSKGMRDISFLDPLKLRN